MPAAMRQGWPPCDRRRARVRGVRGPLHSLRPAGYTTHGGHQPLRLGPVHRAVRDQRRPRHGPLGDPDRRLPRRAPA